jgi:hypothetical protein
VSHPWAKASATRYPSLRTLVAAEGDARVAVLALGPDLDLAAERRAESGQWVDRRRAEQQRDPGEVVEAHRPIVGTARLGGGRAPPGSTRRAAALRGSPQPQSLDRRATRSGPGTWPAGGAVRGRPGLEHESGKRDLRWTVVRVAAATSPALPWRRYRRIWTAAPWKRRLRPCVYRN